MSSAIIVEYTSKKRTVDDFRPAADDVSVVEVVFEADQYSHRGQLALPYCRYTFLCRSVSSTDEKVSGIPYTVIPFSPIILIDPSFPSIVSYQIHTEFTRDPSVD